MRVAAIDCGTNSIRLLVADIAEGRLTDVDRRMEIVRLGEGVDRTGRLSDAALARTFDACGRYAEVDRSAGRPAGPVRGDIRLAGRGQCRRVHQLACSGSSAWRQRSSPA